jgi:predicted ATPase with chaperone activity
MADVNPHERRAQALAEITKLQEDYVSSQERVTQLEAQLRDQETVMQRQINAQEARADIAERHCCLYRAEAQLFRAKLVQMVTTISLVRKATEEAEKIATTINSLIGGETAEEAQREEAEARDIVANLPAAPDRGEHVDVDSEIPGHGDIEEQMQQLLGRSKGRAAGSLT